MTTPHLFTLVAPVGGLFGVLAWRIREARSAVTLPKIVAPPLGMSTGLLMFVSPMFRIPWTWSFAALATGAGLLAYPLIRTSKLVPNPDNGTIGIKRSPAFLLVVVALAVVRYAARGWIGQYISLPQTGALFFLLAFGMIAHWRFRMFMEYRQLTHS